MQSERKKLYRSITGCTVCFVKSGRHGFQDSDKWLKYFKKVFNLDENRTNEICSSCVKHIMKWRRTPKHLKSDLSHIVKDAPQRKSLARKRRASSLVEMQIGTKEEHKLAVMEDNDELSSESEVDDDDCEFDTSSSDSHDEDSARATKEVGSQTSFLYPALTSPQANSFQLPYIDLSKWRQEQICCGVIFRGPSGEVLVDPKWLNPNCGFCNRSFHTPSNPQESREINIFDEKLAALVNSSS